MTDPLDEGAPNEQAWTAFRLSHAAATALRVLLAELRDVAPDYLEDLQTRISDAIVHGDMWSETGMPDGEPWDGYVPLQGPNGGSVNFIRYEDAASLEDQLSPDAAKPYDYLWHMRGVVAATLHSALDTYARAVGVGLGPLPEGIDQLLGRAEATRHLEVEIFQSLVEFDATRHVFVHQAGIVDARYQRAVRNSPLAIGERRPVDDALLERYSRLAWDIAERIRLAVRGGLKAY